MLRNKRSTILALVGLVLLSGCATTRSITVTGAESTPSQDTKDANSTIDSTARSVVLPAGFEHPVTKDSGDHPHPEDDATSTSLNVLEQAALDQNPALRRLLDQYEAAAARSEYVDELPDPKIGATVFGDPIETAAGSQRATMSISQTIPWLCKLSAMERRAYLEALAVLSEFEAERLKVVAMVRTGWYRLYVIDRQVEITKANQELLKSLIEIANSAIAAGAGSRGDVLLGTVELSQLEERLLTLNQQRQAVEAELNRLLARPADASIISAPVLETRLPSLTADEAYQIALTEQPQIEAARLRSEAARWGIEVARLSRRPELTLSASYFFTGANRPPTNVVNVGEDPWAIGAQVSIPLWYGKYNAMESEARWNHQAAYQSVEEIQDRYNALFRDLFAEARRAHETASLYESTILPQARQTLTSDQDAYSNGTVEFDRVIRDYRSLLTLELGYHKAVGDLAAAVARIQQAAGRDLDGIDAEK